MIIIGNLFAIDDDYDQYSNDQFSSVFFSSKCLFYSRKKTTIQASVEANLFHLHDYYIR